MAKTEKIFIDLNEDIVFALEKIRNSHADRIIIVVPKSANLTSSLLSLKLLTRQIVKTNKLVAVSTDDSLGLKLSDRAGIVSVRNPGEVDDSIWEKASGNKEEMKLELESKKRELLDKRQEKDTTSDYKIVDENGEAQEEEKQEEPADEYKEEEDVEEELKINEKKRIPSRLISVGGIKFFAAGDIAQEEEILNLLLPEDKKKIEISEKTIEQDEEKPMLDSQEDDSDEAKQEEERKTRYKPRRSLIGQNLANASASERPRRQTLNNNSSPGVSIMENESVKNYIEKVKAFFNKNENRKKVLIGLGALIVLILIFSIFIGGSVSVSAVVKKDSISVAETITADPVVQDVNIDTLVIPAEIRSTQDDASENATATGTGVGGEKAQGQVTVRNFSDSQVTIPKGTAIKITDSDLSYILQSDVSIPPVADVTSFPTVPIVASAPGENYNATASKDFTVDGFSSNDVTARSSSPITGGTSEETIIVTQEDLDSIKEILKKRIESSAKTTLSSLAGADEIMLEDTITVEITEETSTSNAGDEASSFDVTVKANVKAHFVKKANIEEIVTLIAKRDQEIEGESEINISEFPDITQVILDGEKVKISLASNASAKAAISEEIIAENIEGKSISDAKKYLDGQNDVTSYEISYSPFFVPGFLQKIPSGDRLMIKITAR
jgi:hypothetical protein